MRLRKQKVRPRLKIQDEIRSAKRGLFRIILPFFLVGILFALILIINFAFKGFLFESDYFKVAKVEVLVRSEDSTENPRELEETIFQGLYGQNIFKINLRELKFKIEKLHPEFKEVNIIRVLPNQLKISAKERKAVAQISSGHYFPIDIEGVILPYITNLPDQNPPIISGVQLNNLAKSGFNLSNEKRIMKALELIVEIAKNKNISNYELKRIDLADSDNISFYLDTGISASLGKSPKKFLASGIIEIKIGNSDFKERLKNLQAILAELGTKVREVKYIDLRFKDPTVSSK